MMTDSNGAMTPSGDRLKRMPPLSVKFYPVTSMGVSPKLVSSIYSGSISPKG